jgi:S-adenosylmethionine hydrolase
MNHFISLLSDFGMKDPFVGEMKAVILSICPDVKLVDITHEVEPYNIRMGAFLLASATPYFPVGTVHVAVVDPGVGGGRRPIVAETNRSLFVGPDNGLLLPAAKREGVRRVYHLTNPSLMRDSISSTFHGRDIFAPVAAHLACGTSPKELGVELTDYVQLSFGEPSVSKRGAACTVIHIDHFGNVITNISEVDMVRMNVNGRFSVVMRRNRFQARLVKAYSNLSGRELGLILGSHGFLEIAGRETDTSKRLKAKVGDTIRLSVS